MKKGYVPPELTCYGEIDEITGIFGPTAVNDVFIDHTGNDVSDPDSMGSIDACATVDFEACFVRG